MNTELKKELDRIESDLRGLREQKAAAGRKLEATKEKYAEVLASEHTEEEETKARTEALEARREWGEIVEAIGELEPTRGDVLQIMGDTEASQRNGGNGAAPVGNAPIMGWASGPLLAMDGVREQLDHIATTQSKFGTYDLGTIASAETIVAELSRGLYAADIDVTPTMRRGADRGVQPAIYRPTSFLNLIPTGTTDGNLVPYTQENPVTGAAVEVAEGALKPEAGLTFTDADAPVRTIAAWMKTRKQVLQDVPALRSIMDTRLRYLVQKRLEEQVLAGDGAGVNLRGILNTSGIGTVAYNANVPLTEQLLSGITNVFLNDGAADGIVLNPRDWQSALTEKAHFGGGAGAASTAGSYEYIGGGPWGTTPATIWGVPAIPSQVIPQGRSLVADFSLGAQLLIRDGVSVLFSDSDQDDFLRNRITLLAEMRAALLVWRPALFQDVDLAA